MADELGHVSSTRSRSEQELLPPAWEIRYSKTKNGKMYYFNTITKISTWKRPDTKAKRQGKLSNEEKEMNLKKKAVTSPEVKQSGLALISLHYAKQKETSSDKMLKRKANYSVLIPSLNKVVRRENNSALQKNKKSERKQASVTIQAQQSKTPTLSSPLARKENTSISSHSKTKSNKNADNRKATKRSASLFNVSEIDKVVAKKPYEPSGIIIKEVTPIRQIAIAKRKLLKNSPMQGSVENASKTSDMNKSNNGGDIISNIMKEMEDEGKKEKNKNLCVEDADNKQNTSSPLYLLQHNTAKPQSPSVHSGALADKSKHSFSFDSQSSPASTPKDIPTSSKKQNLSFLSNSRAAQTPQINTDQRVCTEILTNSNSNYDYMSSDNMVNKLSPSTSSNIATSEHRNNYFEPNKWHNSPLSNRLDSGNQHHVNNFLFTENINTHLIGQPSPSGADVEQDVEDMEVDEEVILSDLLDLRTQATSFPNVNEVKGVLTEIVMKTKPSHPLDRSRWDNHKCQLMLVVDTNVLISCLVFLQELITLNIPERGYVILIIPWVVIQELDYLKIRKNNSNNYNASTSARASKAIHFIHNLLMNEHPQLIGQTPSEAKEESGLDIRCNDDRILQCCLQFQKKYVESEVVLLSRDVNLNNKALIMGIKGTSNETLWSHLKIPKPNFCQRQLSNESGSSSKDMSQKKTPVKIANATKRFSPSPEVTSKCEIFNKSVEGNGNQVLRHSTMATTSRSSPLTVDQHLTKSESSKDTYPSLTKVPVENLRPKQTPLGRQVVISKFDTVWKLIYEIKLQVATIVEVGMSHANYNEAVQMLHVIIPLLSVLKNDFNRCLSLSPVILWEHGAEFSSLCACLNTFFMQAHLSYTDSSQPVDVSMLMSHFYEKDNRPMLFVGLEQLSSFVTEFEEIFKKCST